MEVTLTTRVTPRPTSTPRPQWQPVSIASVEEAFKNEGYSRNPVMYVWGVFWAFIVWALYMMAKYKWEEWIDE
jgi:hypothetical protein